MVIAFGSFISLLVWHFKQYACIYLPPFLLENRPLLTGMSMDSPITLYDEVLLLLVSTSLICNNGIDDLPPVIGPPFKFVFLLLVCQESITPESMVLGKKYDSIYADKFCIITLYLVNAEKHQKEKGGRQK
jgi:hypothetical protein